MKRTIKDYIIVLLKGSAMGAADVVPGVSGGTIAFISGIYEELLDSINSINLKNIKELFCNFSFILLFFVFTFIFNSHYVPLVKSIHYRHGC